MTSEDRRRHVRIDSTNPSELDIYEDEATVNKGKGKTVNISESGVLLETQFPLTQKQTISLIITLKNEFVYISGKVVHSVCEDDDRYKTGIEFFAIDDTGQKILKKYINLFIADQLTTFERPDGE